MSAITSAGNDSEVASCGWEMTGEAIPMEAAHIQYFEAVAVAGYKSSGRPTTIPFFFSHLVSCFLNKFYLPDFSAIVPLEVLIPFDFTRFENFTRLG